MSFINYMAREINCKIVYYGPGLCGKTTNRRQPCNHCQSRTQQRKGDADTRGQTAPHSAANSHAAL